MDKIHLFLAASSPFYRPFSIITHTAGVRVGEMAGLKWKNADFKIGVVKVQETRVRGEEGRLQKIEPVQDVIR